MESTKSHGLPKCDLAWSPSTRRKSQFPSRRKITDRNRDAKISRDRPSFTEHDQDKKKDCETMFSASAYGLNLNSELKSLNEKLYPRTIDPKRMENSTSVGVASTSHSCLPKFPDLIPVPLPGLSCSSSAEKSLSRHLNLDGMSCTKRISLKVKSLVQEADSSTQLEKNTSKRSGPLDRPDSAIFSCELCEKKFLSRSGYLRHLQVHAGKKPFICRECGTAFLQSRDLTIHMRIHSGEKPHTCSLCGASFTQSGSLTKHTRIHTGARPFICSVCGQTFSNSSNLNVHRRTHTGERPFKCPDCGKAFPQPSDLKRHKRMHVGNKNFCCSSCKKKFTRFTDLSRHEQVHSGAKALKYEDHGGLLQSRLRFKQNEGALEKAAV